MKYPIVSLILSLLTALSFSCSRQEKKPEPVDTSIDRFDEDRDGNFSVAERETMNAEFLNRFDKDGDQKLSVEERREIANDAQVSIRVSPASNKKAQALDSIFRRLDRDGDAHISESEAGEKRWKVISRRDANGDGSVSMEEWAASQNPGSGLQN